MVMTVLQYTYTDLYVEGKKKPASQHRADRCVCVDGHVGVRACACGGIH